MAERCPTCNSPKPHLHPAVQFEGETETCVDDFHLREHNQQTAANIANVMAKRAALSKATGGGMSDNPKPLAPSCAACSVPRGTCFPFPCKFHHTRLINSVKELAQVVDDLLPYARATIGAPEPTWQPDSVILRGRVALKRCRDMGYFEGEPSA